jgi:8-oxo-dGTP pyrophosphatase MutT (NUDIX family)
MDELWELPPEIRSYITDHELPIQLYSSPLTKGFEGLQPNSGIVTAVVKNDSQKILFLKHTEDERFWELPSGHIEDHEDPEDAIRREVLEETAIKLQNVTPMVAIVWPFEDTMRVQIVFHAQVGEYTEYQVDDEAGEIEWRTDIPENVTFGELGQDIYQYYLNSWDENTQNSDEHSYKKHGAVATIGVGLTMAAVKAIQIIRNSDEDDEE